MTDAQRASIVLQVVALRPLVAVPMVAERCGGVLTEMTAGGCPSELDLSTIDRWYRRWSAVPASVREFYVDALASRDHLWAARGCIAAILTATRLPSELRGAIRRAYDDLRGGEPVYDLTPGCK